MKSPFNVFGRGHGLIEHPIDLKHGCAKCLNVFCFVILALQFSRNRLTDSIDFITIKGFITPSFAKSSTYNSR